MKTITIKTLKKELLVIELPTAETKISIGLHCIGIKPPPIGKDASDINGYYHIYTEMFHGFKLLGKPDEIKEDEAKELVEETEMGVKLNSKKYKYRAYDSQLGYATALESFHSALEKEILWENPIKIPSSDDINWFTNQRDGDFSERYTRVFNWYNNQEKTFDRNISIIFVKK